jgi:ribosomal protein L35
MPKLKTHSGTKDRVKVSKNGKVRAGHPNITGLSTRTGTIAKTIKKNLGK